MARYIYRKIVLLRQLGISVTDDVLRHICGLPNEIAVDNYAHDLILRED